MLRAQTLENMSDFKKADIYPLDMNVFSESDFLSFCATDRPPQCVIDRLGTLRIAAL